MQMAFWKPISNIDNRKKIESTSSTKGFYDDLKTLLKSKNPNAEKETLLFELLKNNDKKSIQPEIESNTVASDIPVENKKRGTLTNSNLYFYEFEMKLLLAKK